MKTGKVTGKAITMDGPFAETKELVVGYWPARAGRYASVNGLRMYYEIHGRGRPLVMLHSGLGTIETSFSKVMPLFAGSRRIIAIEQQAHGRTADIDRNLSHEQMADDTAELLRQLEIEQADFVGYSMGAPSRFSWRSGIPVSPASWRSSRAVTTTPRDTSRRPWR